MSDKHPALAPFDTFTAIAVPIDIANCDTDQLFPARFLRVAEDDPKYPGFLLHDVRFNSDGSLTDFIFNVEPYSNGRIFVSDINWGCGSSRETAVSVLVQNGIRAVIAPSFGDIHYTNCIKNGLLPIRLSATNCESLRQQLHQSPGAEISIDLPCQHIAGPDGQRYDFDIDPFDKQRLIQGLDDIGLTMTFDKEITAFAADYALRHRWAVPDK